MTYMQISTVAFDDLDELSLMFVENAEPEMFCYITDGDESEQYSVEPIEKTLDTVLKELVYGERVVFGEEPEGPTPKEYLRVRTWWGEVAWQKDVD